MMTLSRAGVCMTSTVDSGLQPYAKQLQEEAGVTLSHGCMQGNIQQHGVWRTWMRGTIRANLLPCRGTMRAGFQLVILLHWQLHVVFQREAAAMVLHGFGQLQGYYCCPSGYFIGMLGIHIQA